MGRSDLSLKPGPGASCSSLIPIQSGSDSIASELRKARKELGVLLDRAKATLRALSIELDEGAERCSALAVSLTDSGDLLQ